MGLAARVAGVTVSFALLAGGGYVVADLYDVVPGFITLEPVPAPAASFPSVPGASAPAEPLTISNELDPSAKIPKPTNVADLTKDFLAEKDEIGSKVSVLVVDVLTGDVLAEHKPDKARVPASTLKLLPVAAALISPGAQATLDTVVVQNSPGEVFLVGGGDMLLAAGAGDPTSVNGHAGLGDLAEQVAAGLRAMGQDTVNVKVDETLFTGPKVSPTVLPDNVHAGYIAPITPIAVDGALRPDAPLRSPRFTEPSLAAARDFIEALTANGITVEADPVFGTAPEGATVLGAVHSAPLGQIVDYVLQSSDNTIAEVIGRIVAVDAGLPGSFDGARSAVLAAVARMGVDTKGLKIADSSGLGDGSKLTTRALAYLVKDMVDPKHPLLRNAAVGMPIAGLSGTLDDRFVTSSARGMVRAKTGSLPEVTSMAGTARTVDGRLLAFAVLLDGVPEGGAWAARVHVDAFVTSLAGCGC